MSNFMKMCQLMCNNGITTCPSLTNWIGFRSINHKNVASSYNLYSDYRVHSRTITTNGNNSGRASPTMVLWGKGGRGKKAFRIRGGFKKVKHRYIHTREDSDESRGRYWHKLQFNFSAGKHWIPIAREPTRALRSPFKLPPSPSHAARRRFIDSRPNRNCNKRHSASAKICFYTFSNLFTG